MKRALITVVTALLALVVTVAPAAGTRVGAVEFSAGTRVGAASDTTINGSQIDGNRVGR